MPQAVGAQQELQVLGNFQLCPGQCNVTMLQDGPLRGEGFGKKAGWPDDTAASSWPRPDFQPDGMPRWSAGFTFPLLVVSRLTQGSHSSRLARASCLMGYHGNLARCQQCGTGLSPCLTHSVLNRGPWCGNARPMSLFLERSQALRPCPGVWEKTLGGQPLWL